MDNPPIFPKRGSDSVLKFSSLTISASASSRFSEAFFDKEEIGRGGFGKVFKATLRDDGICYAIKRIPLHISKDKDRPRREVNILQNLASHPCVISYKGHWEETGLKEKREQRDRDEIRNYSTSFKDTWTDESSIKDVSSGGVSFSKVSSLPDANIKLRNESKSESSRSRIPMQAGSEESSSGSTGATRDIYETFLYIQMELCYHGEDEEKKDGDDHEFTLKQALLNARDKLDLGSIFKQVVDGIAHIHGHGVLHRDIKPGNVFFVDATLKQIKIGDLGIARMIDQEGGDNVWKYSPNVGTDCYMSPEILELDGVYDTKTDIYSLGLLTFELFYPISTAMERKDLFDGLRQPVPNFPDGNHLSSNKVELITSMLQKDKSQRPSAQEIKQSNVYKSIVVAVTEGTSD